MPRMRARGSRRAARLIPPLGRGAWRLLAGVLVFEIGTGMTLPLVIVYLHQARGLGLGGAGAAVSMIGAGGLARTLGAGVIADRYGAGRTAVGGLLLGGAGTAGYLAVHGVWSAMAAAGTQGAGFAAAWVGMFPLLVRAVDPSLRGDVLGTNYGVTNVGLGLGSAIAGAVLAARPSAFTLLFTVDAVTYCLLALALVRLGATRDAGPDGASADGPGYLTAARDRTLVAATGINLLLVVAGYSQFSAAFPAWATDHAGASRSLVGFAFAANTWAVAFAQLPALAMIRGHRRTRAVAVTAALFSLCWLVVLGAGETASRMVVTAGLLAGPAVFGLGEALLSPSLPGIVNDVAPEALRARYVAVYSLSWQIGPIVGPAVSGAALAAGQGVPLLLGLAAACALGAPAALLFERLVPERANRPLRLSRPGDAPA